MHPIDTEKLARKAGLTEIGGCTEANLQKLVKLVLEEAAKRFDPSPNAEMFRQDIADELRALAEGVR